MARELQPTDKVLVCDKCLRACCWYGEFMCEDAVGAGLVVMTVDDLRKLSRESEDYWSDETMIKIYGDADREFVT
jgi:hypothetical protein